MSRYLRGSGAAVVLALGMAPSALSYEYPTIERGFKPERSFQVGDIDNIKLLNGGLEIAIPIGGRYPVGPSFSYGLTLHYSQQLWDYLIRDSQLDPGQEPVTQAHPGRGFNAGFGWRLSLGEYWDHTSTGPGSCRRCYIAPSGARHQFYNSLHPGQVADGAWYTRDGTFLRFRDVVYMDDGTPVAGFEIDFPSGETHLFDPFGRVIQMRDAFGNAVEVDHSSSAIVISDPHRSQTIHLESAPHYGTRVDKVVVSAFNGTTAEYDFVYSNQAVPRSCLDDDDHPVHGTSPSVSLSLLTSVVLPDDSSFSMPPSSYHLTGGICSSPGSSTAALQGLLSKVRLPTLGSVEWVWQAYQFPVPVAEIDQGDVVPMWLSRTAGVWKRRLLRANNDLEAEWVYTQELSGGQLADESITRVTSPLGDRTDHYFTAGDEETVSYGLPFSPLESAPFAGFTDLFRSTEVYDCNSSGGGCQLRRTTYLKYVSEIPQNLPGPEFNSRIEASLTRHHDDSQSGTNRWAAVRHSNWDGLGNWRESATAGNYPGNNVRISLTGYNPAAGTFPGTFTMPPVGQPWILGDFDAQEVTEAGVTARSESCFDTNTGALLRQRTLKNGTTRHETDLLSVFTRNGAGFVTTERHYGGDLQTIGTGGCAMALPTQAYYQLEHGYSSGVRASSRYRNPTNGQIASHFLLNRTIDENTGLAESARDMAGLETIFDYDALWRLTSEEPELAHEAHTEYDYDRATSASNLAKVGIRRINQVNLSVLAESALEFDAFGRVRLESRQDRSNTTRSRTTTYNPNGWRESVSEWGTTDHKTTYSDYDPFGRPGTITAPDGHQVSFGYVGDRVVSRNVSIATGANEVGEPIETISTTTERVDRHGRPVEVTEPSGTDGANITTAYTYDIGGRLAGVSTTSGVTQTRTFSYDRRGFLLSETHPEKGAPVTYHNYDARGHATRKVDGPNDLSYDFDRFERLTQVKRTAGGQSLKRFTYATSHNQDGTGDSLGKVIRAERDNHVQFAGTNYIVSIRQILGYHGRGGRLSSRTTENWIQAVGSPPPAAASDSFLQSMKFNRLGDTESITYPAFGWESPRTIEHTYAKGWLTEVAPVDIGSWATFGYHSNGMLASITHKNGVNVQLGVDPHSVSRPRSIATSGVVGSQNWSTGFYRYDGAGNVTNIGDSGYIYDKVSRVISATVPLTLAPFSVAPATTGTLIFADGFESGDTSAWGQAGPPSAAYQGFRYDTFGNLIEIIGTPGRVIPVSSTTNRLTGAGITHDTAGNVTAWSGNSYTYGPFNETWKTNSSGDEWIHLYDANDQRVWSFGVAGTGTNRNRYTLRGLDDKVLREYSYIRNTNTWTLDRELIYRGTGQLLAAVTTEGERHFHLDHLGSPRLITDGSGNQVAFHSYFPYGEEATALNQNSLRNKFTGHERDLGNPNNQADDLDYMHARYHNPLVGRFLTVDPAGSSAITRLPQSWNRYTYVRANPLLLTDPDGRKVAVRDDASLNLIRRMVPTQLSNHVSLGPDQMLRVAPEGSHPNLDGLRALVASEGTVTVRTGKSFSSGDPFLFESAASIQATFPSLAASEIAPTIALGETNPGESGNAEVVVSDGTGPASGAPGVELVKTMAHELLGHALPYIQGKPWLHGDPGVDQEIDAIHKRTEEACGKNKSCGL